MIKYEVGECRGRANHAERIVTWEMSESQRATAQAEGRMTTPLLACNGQTGVRTVSRYKNLKRRTLQVARCVAQANTICTMAKSSKPRMP